MGVHGVMMKLTVLKTNVFHITFKGGDRAETNIIFEFSITVTCSIGMQQLDKIMKALIMRDSVSPFSPNQKKPNPVQIEYFSL